MDVYFGTVRRGASMRDGGALFRFDWEDKRVQAVRAIYPRNPSLDGDPNDRGGGRGCRGIIATGREVIAADYHTIRRFDRSLAPTTDLSHDLMVGLHELALSRDGVLWISATGIDMALGFDIDSGLLVESLAPREMPEFQAELDLVPLGIDPTIDNRDRWLSHDTKLDTSHIHLNALALSGKRVLALLSRFGAIVDLTERRIIARDPALERGHNLEILPDGTLASVDTHGRTVRFYDPDDGALVHVVDLMAFPWMRSLRRSVKQSPHADLAKPLFTRGLAFDGDHFIAGTSPASIVLVNWRTSTLEDTHQHSQDVREAIHGLAIAPST